MSEIAAVFYYVPHPTDVRMLFDDIESAFLNEPYEGMDLYDIVLEFFKEKGYIILQKADK